MDKIKPRWKFSMQTVKDIYAQTLRKLIPRLTNKEVKESLKKNEEKLTLKFKAFLVLMKDIENEEEWEQEATEEETKDIEENDPINIATVVIASLPHSPRKVLTTSIMEIASPGLIVSNTPSTPSQSIFAPI